MHLFIVKIKCLIIFIVYVIKMTTVDCNDPKNKDNVICQSGKMLGEIIGFPILVTIMTLGVWILGGIIIALVWHHSNSKYKTAVLVIGIIICILIAPTGILLLQNFAHWPVKDL